MIMSARIVTEGSNELKQVGGHADNYADEQILTLWFLLHTWMFSIPPASTASKPQCSKIRPPFGVIDTAAPFSFLN
jgi:hypothetical protein